MPSFQILWHLWWTASSTVSMSTASSSIASFIPCGSLWNSMVPWKAGFGHYFDVASVSSLSVRRFNPSTISMLLASAPLCPPPCSAGGSMRGLFGTSATSLVDMLVLMTPLATHGSQGTLGQSDSLLDIHSAFAALRRWPCISSSSQSAWTLVCLVPPHRVCICLRFAPFVSTVAVVS